MIRCLCTAGLVLLAVQGGAREISIGLNSYDNSIRSASWVEAIEALGVDAVHLRFHPAKASATVDPVTANLNMLASLVDLCRRHDWTLTLNMEDANWYVPMYAWGTTYPSSNPPLAGYEYTVDWYHQDDGTYRFDIDDVFLEFLAESGVFVGAVYDEPTHMQLGWNPYNRKWNADPDAPWLPYWTDTHRYHRLEDAYEATVAACRAVREHYSDRGFVLATEQVWPVMFHTYARAGIVPGTKYLKEHWTPVTAMIAAGAAQQYGLPYWVSPDLWGYDGFGLHAAAEYDASLKLAFWLGAQVVYTEVLRNENKALVDDNYNLTDYGRVLRDFATVYVPGRTRGYTHLDLQPEIAIVRFPDSCFGVGQAWLPDTLYGSRQLPVDATAEAWFAVWNLLTHGYVGLQGLTWHSGGYGAHDFFCPLNAVLVYDHRAPAELLCDVRLFFLTGYAIEPETQAAVAARVEEGAWAVAMPHLAPEAVRSHWAGEETQVIAGAGRWILTRDFQGTRCRGAVARFGGAADELRFLAADREVIFKPRDGDPNRMDITVEEFANRARARHGAAATASSQADATRWAARNAIDGVTDDPQSLYSWSSAGFSGTEWLAVDFGAPLPVNRIVLHPRVWADGFPVDFALQSGDDGVAWTTIPGQQYEDYARPPVSASGLPEPQVFDFAEQRRRRWRVLVTEPGTDGYGSPYVQLAEVAIGHAGATPRATGTPYPTATPGPSRTPTPTWTDSPTPTDSPMPSAQFLLVD